MAGLDNGSARSQNVYCGRSRNTFHWAGSGGRTRPDFNLCRYFANRTPASAARAVPVSAIGDRRDEDGSRNVVLISDDMLLVSKQDPDLVDSRCVGSL